MSVVAAVDCGTNSTRLLVKDGERDVLRATQVTGLGRRAGASGRLDSAAIARVADTLREYRAEMDRAGVERFRVVATAAVRGAPNRDAFEAAVADAIGQAPDVITGEEEGRLSFRGATRALAPSLAPFLVCDVGGGSTELVYGHTEPEALWSFDVGSVRLTEAFLHTDPPDPGELADAIDVVRGYLEEVTRERPELREPATLVGLAGTVTTMAAVEIGLAEYSRERVHGFRLTRSAAEDVFRTLATEPAADRRWNPGLPAERVDTIVGGACVVVAVMRHFDADEILVSEDDLLDAIAADLT